MMNHHHRHHNHCYYCRYHQHHHHHHLHRYYRHHHHYQSIIIIIISTIIIVIILKAGNGSLALIILGPRLRGLCTWIRWIYLYQNTFARLSASWLVQVLITLMLYSEFQMTKLHSLYLCARTVIKPMCTVSTSFHLRNWRDAIYQQMSNTNPYSHQNIILTKILTLKLTLTVTVTVTLILILILILTQILTLKLTLTLIPILILTQILTLKLTLILILNLT